MYKQQQPQVYIGTTNITKPANQLPSDKLNKFNELYKLFLINDYDTIINSLDDVSNTNIFQLNNEDNETLIFAILKNESGDLTELQKLFIIEKLVLKNVPVNISSSKNDQNPLHLACMKKYMNIIKYLVEKGCNKDKLDNFGKAPIHYFAENLVYDCVQGYDFYDNANMSKKDICKPTKTELLVDYLFIREIQNKLDTEGINKDIDEYIDLNKFYKAKEIQDLITQKYDKYKEESIKTNDKDLIKKSILNELLIELKSMYNKYEIKDCNDDEIFKIKSGLEKDRKKIFDDYTANIDNLSTNISELNDADFNIIYEQFISNLNYIFIKNLLEKDIDAVSVLDKYNFSPDINREFYDDVLYPIYYRYFIDSSTKNINDNANLLLKMKYDFLKKDYEKTSNDRYNYFKSLLIFLKKNIYDVSIKNLYISINKDIMITLLDLDNKKNLSIPDKNKINEILSVYDELYKNLYSDYDDLYKKLDDLKFKSDFSYILQNTNYLKNYLIDLDIIKFNVCDLRNFLDEHINNLYILCTYIYKNVNDYLDKIKNDYKSFITIIKLKFPNFEFTDDLFRKKYDDIIENTKILNNIYINIKNIFSSVNKIIENGNKILSIDYISNPTKNIVFNKFNLIPIENFSDTFNLFYSKYINDPDKFKEYLVSKFFMKITDNNYNIITIECDESITTENILINERLLELSKESLEKLIKLFNYSFDFYTKLPSKFIKNDVIEQYHSYCKDIINKIDNSLIIIINLLTNKELNKEQLLELKNNINIIETYNYLLSIINKYLLEFNKFIRTNENEFKNSLSIDEFNKVLESLKIDLEYANLFNINGYDVIKLLKQLYTQKIIELNSIYPKVPIPKSVDDTNFIVGYNTNYLVKPFEYDPNKIIVSKFTNIGKDNNSKYFKGIILDTPLICVEYIDSLLCKIYKYVLEQFKKDSIYETIEIKIDDKIKDNKKIEKLYNNIKESSNYNKFFEDKTKLAINLYMQEKIYAEILKLLEENYSGTFIISDSKLILSNTTERLYNKEINKHFIKYVDKKLNKGTSNKLIRGKCYSNPKLLEQMIEYKFNFFTEDVNKSTILFYLIDERNNKAIEELIKLIKNNGLNPHIFMVKNNSNLTPEQYVEENIKLLDNTFSEKTIEEKITSFQNRLIKRINEDEQFGDIGIKDDSTNISELLNTIINKFIEKYKSEDKTKFDNLYKNYQDLEKYEDCEFNELNNFIVELLRNELCNGMIDIFNKTMIEYLYEECKTDSTELLKSNSNTIKEFLHVSIYSKLKIQNPDITYRDPKDYIRELSRNFIRNLDLPELDTCLNNVLLMYKILVEEMSSFVYKMVIDISNDSHEIYLLSEIKKTITNVQTGITDNMKIAETKKNENEEKRLKELDDMKEKFKPKVETKS